ncbi:MinD/ParA family ATP-binding protein [Halomarina litorea]|uniref:MinD/ParA family ATP-binding protein n=1 Tax=Halomarina litorea TaxID=2961595 RepID=UPI0020C3A460|nr:AAA family ATPase [Halomarina sp. BCD28]
MILAVTGGKGGVGKSTVAYALGHHLDAVVVDADLGMADLPSARGPDLHDVLAGRATAPEAVREDGPVDLLPCGRSLRGARAADPRRLVDALGAVEREYGRVVVDCAAGLGSDVGLPLLAADACVVVTTPDEVALVDAVRTRALARELDAGLAAVALNRVREESPTERVERLFGAPVVAIPAAASVPRSTAAGLPAGTRSGQVREAVGALAARVQSSSSRSST